MKPSEPQPTSKSMPDFLKFFLQYPLALVPNGTLAAIDASHHEDAIATWNSLPDYASSHKSLVFVLENNQNFNPLNELDVVSSFPFFLYTATAMAIHFPKEAEEDTRSIIRAIAILHNDINHPEKDSLFKKFLRLATLSSSATLPQTTYPLALAVFESMRYHSPEPLTMVPAALGILSLLSFFITTWVFMAEHAYNQSLTPAPTLETIPTLNQTRRSPRRLPQPIKDDLPSLPHPKKPTASFPQTSSTRDRLLPPPTNN